MLGGFEIVSGLADGASVMPAKWNKPVFSFRFYEGRISRPPLHISSRAAPQITSYRHCRLMAKPKRAFLVLLRVSLALTVQPVHIMAIEKNNVDVDELRRRWARQDPGRAG